MFLPLLFATLFSPPQTAQDQTPASSQPATQSDTGILTFRVTTREVVVNVIALDGHDRPILDLHPADLQVFDPTPNGTPQHKHRPIPQTPTDPITSFTLIDPTLPSAPLTDPRHAGLRLSTSCLERATLHYQLAYHPGPGGLTPGYHDVLIVTPRRGVRLFYRHRYYIGATAPDPKNLPDKLSARDRAQLADQFGQSACYHPSVPPSIGLRAWLIETGGPEQLRYSVAVDADSLGYISVSGNGRRVQLDYAVCNFDTTGHPIDYFHASVDQVLTPVEYARALAHGFPHILDFATPPHLGLSRFVVRDLVTGNIGMVDTIYPFATEKPPAPAALAKLRQEERAQVRTYRGMPLAPQGPLGSFGSVIPAPDTFCGDVYEIPGNTGKLPDFRDLDPIASIYTSFLDVPNQIITGTSGIPGITPRTAWFGIDYHATFWIRNPGDYEFQIASDDGAILQIDDQRVINDDGAHMVWLGSGHIQLAAGPHVIHVPYFQGPLDEVALQLWVKGPGADWTIFDLRNFPPLATGESARLEPSD